MPVDFRGKYGSASVRRISMGFAPFDVRPIPFEGFLPLIGDRCSY